MIRFLICLLIVSSFSFALAPTAWTAGEEPLRDNAIWKIRMQKMLRNVETLIPFAFELDRTKADPSKVDDSKQILSALQALEADAAGLREHTKHGKAGALDPSFRFIAISFENEIAQAKAGFSKPSRNIEEIQGHTRAAISKCMQCHTQSPVGPSLNLERFKSQFGNLSPASRVVAFAATRQFENALETFSQMMNQAEVIKPDVGSFDRSARIAISIAVRVNRDPKKALALVQRIESSGAGSPIMKGNLEGWKKDISDWLAAGPATTQSDALLFQEATRLRNSATPSDPGLDAYRSRDVALLRASGLLHDLLVNYPNSSLRAKSYLELAKIYDSLPGFAIWDLSDEYLATCIQENPHSDIAETCFQEYDQSIFLGYTGSSGTHIPTSVQQHMAMMKSLATKPKPPAKRAKPGAKTP